MLDFPSGNSTVLLQYSTIAMLLIDYANRQGYQVCYKREQTVFSPYSIFLSFLSALDLVSMNQCSQPSRPSEGRTEMVSSFGSETVIYRHPLVFRSAHNKYIKLITIILTVKQILHHLFHPYHV
jgi:hypothetical protein